MSAQPEPLEPPEYCTCGQSIPPLNVIGNPCRRRLLILNGAKVCPRCDSWPGKT